MRRRPNTTATIWGLAFIAVAVVAILHATGVMVRLACLGVLVPLVLIGLGIIALLLNLRN